MGFEPGADFAPSNCNSPTCVDCEMRRAANALHSGCFQWLEVALKDTDLQRVIAAWRDMPAPIRSAVLALVEERA